MYDVGDEGLVQCIKAIGCYKWDLRIEGMYHMYVVAR